VSRLLVLLPDLPYPLDAGAKIRNNGLLRLLADDHEVDALAFGEADCGAELAKLVRRSVVVPPPAARSPVRRAADMARTGLPDVAHRRVSRSFREELRCFLQDGAYDAVQAEGIEMAGYLWYTGAGRRIYDAHNAEYLLQRRFAEAAPTLAGRLYSRVQWRRLARFERDVIRSSRLTLAVSHHDANQLRALASSEANVQVVRNGIDGSTYDFAPSRADVPPNVLFLGKLDFRPNADALRWFVDDVLPALRAAVTQVRLFAVGAAPPEWLVRVGQHDERVAVTGYVPDERPYLERCAALILPLRVGGGSRLKALIALASGVPIVSTRVGMEGLEAEPGLHYLAAESPAEWVDALQRLLSDTLLRQRLAHAGRQLVEQKYDWSAIRADVRAAYQWLSV
jgi:glycosyltransferase involved in cell wall biosynthesis